MKKKLKKYFIPHEENEHKPYFLREKSTLSVILLILLFEVIGLFVFTPIFNGKLDNLAAIFPSVLVSKTNEERLNLGENKLVTDNTLISAAQLKANDMAEKGYFAHVSPDGKDPWYWLAQAGYNYDIAGENLAVNFIDSEDVHDAWMNSPGHKSNIIRDGFTEIGIATAEGFYKDKKAIFVAQYFAKPKSVITENVITEENFVNDNQEVNVLSAQSVALDLTEEETIEKTGVENSFSAKATKDRQEPELEEVVEEKQTQVLSAQSSVSDNEEEVSVSEKLMSSPKTLISYILYVIAVVVLAALILKIFIKVKIQHKNLIVNGIIILLVIFAILYMNQIIATIDAQI